MHFTFDNPDRPLFLQIADGIKDEIVKGILKEEQQIPSSTELSLAYRINPATVNKGVGLLVDEGIVYKQRGIGMFVAPGAREKLIGISSAAFVDTFVTPMLNEAKKLGIDKAALHALIDEADK